MTRALPPPPASTTRLTRLADDGSPVDAWVALARPRDGGPAQLDCDLGGVPRPVADKLAALAASPEFKAKPGDAAISPAGDASAPRTVLLGLGGKDTDGSSGLRLAGAALGRLADRAKLARARLISPDDGMAAQSARWATALAEGAGLARFCFKPFAGAAQGQGAEGDIALALVAAETHAGAVQAGIDRASAVNTARWLAACPPNAANPQTLAEWAVSHASPGGLGVEVLDADRLEREGMQGLLSVGRAGSQPPCLVVIEHPGDDPTQAPVCLVGKGVTFDTGGYSLKTRDGMAGMKYDKCGAMAVLGLMPYLGALGVKRRVIGVAALAENMVDSGAYRPDDILTLSNGVSVEITNTDAEGRLCLADALAYATRTFAPAAMIDLATLTGGVNVALGPYHTGLWCNDPELREQLQRAATASGEALWELPLTADHREMMSAQHADLVNSAPGRACHATQGAAFLSHFVGASAATRYPAEVPWAHLDIAGTAHTDAKPPLWDKGPTGAGVRLLIDYLVGFGADL
ncbi:MAG: leucyl aminopeptidase family protein [Planctomycetota bacterium]